MYIIWTIWTGLDNFWTLIGHFRFFVYRTFMTEFGNFEQNNEKSSMKRQKGTSRTVMKKDSRAQKTSKIHTYISSINTQVLTILSSKTSFSS